MVGQENERVSPGGAVTVFVLVVRRVTVVIKVAVSVVVSKGVQDRAARLWWLAATAVVDGVLPLEVVLGGVYARAQSVSSCSVAPWSLVTVTGTQLNSLASSGS